MTAAPVPSSAPLNPWSRSRRKDLPAVPGATDRPTVALLTALRAHVEQGRPFDLARRACGVPEAVHEAWLERGLAIHDKQPDRLYHAGGVVLAGSLEPEAEYARIVTTVQAGAAADLVGKLWDIARDPARRRDQLSAITLLLRGMGESVFDPRTELDARVTAVDARTGGVDQAVLDALSPAERTALREAARAAGDKLAAAEAALGAAHARLQVAAPTEPESLTG